MKSLTKKKVLICVKAKGPDVMNPGQLPNYRK